jgi:hypothetical protein
MVRSAIADVVWDCTDAGISFAKYDCVTSTAGGLCS